MGEWSSAQFLSPDNKDLNIEPHFSASQNMCRKLPAPKYCRCIDDGQQVAFNASFGNHNVLLVETIWKGRLFAPSSLRTSCDACHLRNM